MQHTIFSMGFLPTGFRAPISIVCKCIVREKNASCFPRDLIGAYPKAKIKEKMMGWRQKREILKFVKLLNPSVAFGTNSAAIDRLRREGIRVEYLYLFGNIPHSPIPAGSHKEKFQGRIFWHCL